MQATIDVLHERGVPDERIYVTLERHMDCGVGLCGHCQLGPFFVCKDGPVFVGRRARTGLRHRGDVMATTHDRGQRRPRVGVVKFASCDGCQLTLLDLEDELLEIAARFDIVEFAEATSNRSRGPYDVLLVEGSISTPEQADEIVRLRRETTLLVTIGACATSGGIQALRNLGDHDAFRSAVYPKPELIESLATSTPVSAHVAVDAELFGCPISGRQLLELLTALRRRPPAPAARRGGLRRVQAAGQSVHPRRRRCPLPRAGDAHRLRRAVPDLRARLLRLLRTQGGGQYASRSRRGSSRSARATRRSAGSSPSSMSARRPSARSSRPSDDARPAPCVRDGRPALSRSAI